MNHDHIPHHVLNEALRKTLEYPDRTLVDDAVEALGTIYTKRGFVPMVGARWGPTNFGTETLDPEQRATFVHELAPPDVKDFLPLSNFYMHAGAVPAGMVALAAMEHDVSLIPDPSLPPSAEVIRAIKRNPTHARAFMLGVQLVLVTRAYLRNAMHSKEYGCIMHNPRQARLECPATAWMEFTEGEEEAMLQRNVHFTEGRFVDLITFMSHVTSELTPVYGILARGSKTLSRTITKSVGDALVAHMYTHALTRPRFKGSESDASTTSDDEDDGSSSR